jgi:hypothetical protein
VPAGHGVLTWTYRAPGWTVGWVLSACALAALAVLIVWALATRRTRSPESVPRP